METEHGTSPRNTFPSRKDFFCSDTRYRSKNRRGKKKNFFLFCVPPREGLSSQLATICFQEEKTIRRRDPILFLSCATTS